MNNLQKAKAMVYEKNAEETAINNVINPPPIVKKIKVPPARDVNLIQSILMKRLDDRTRTYKEKIEETIEKKYKNKFDEIHKQAIALKAEAERIGNEIVAENNRSIKLTFLDKNSYSAGYLKDLPENIDEARDEVKMSIEDDQYPIIEKMKGEIEDFILNVKLGCAPIADVKPLLEKIDKELKV